MKHGAQKNNQKPTLLIVASILAIAGLVFGLEVTNTTHIFHNKNVVLHPDTAGGASENNQKGEDQVNASTSTQTPASGEQPGDNKSPTQYSGSGSLLAPTGNFVSNHHPNLSGSPAPATLTSVCTTTPGATCTISFTKDGVTKFLAQQVTDRGGSAYWNNWNINSIELTAGSWQIQASATLDGQTKTAADTLQLVVAQ